VELGDDSASAVLMSDILTVTSPTPACLSLQYIVSSPDVNLTVALSSSSENLSSSFRVVVAHSLGRWQQSVVVRADERLFISASKLRPTTRRAVTYPFLSDVSLTRGNCSSDAANGKCQKIVKIGTGILKTWTFEYSGLT